MKIKRDEILKFLKSGKAITGIIAFEKFQTIALPQHIFALRKRGYIIDSEIVKSETSSYSLYWMTVKNAKKIIKNAKNK